MIVRKLRSDENYKLDSVQSIAFNFSADVEPKDDDNLDEEVIGAFLDDNETICATIIPSHSESYYCGKVFGAVGIGGVSTLPEHRRGGYIRAIFNEIFRLAPERGWVTSYLYPFSYNYYRQFGYERIYRYKKLKMPISYLDCVERNTDAVLYTGNALSDTALEIYNKFAVKFNAMYKRSEAEEKYYPPNPHKKKKYTYIYRDSAYASFYIDDECLNVSELVYTDAEALKGILGFLRMYEGQVYEICFRELPECTELEYILKKYIDAECSMNNGAMGRILQTEPLLKANMYPETHGHFMLKVNDFLEYNRGIYEVEYVNGISEVRKLANDTDKYDIEVSVPTLTRIMLGGDNFTAESASYLPDIGIKGCADDFFRAFPKRKLHLYDKF